MNRDPKMSAMPCGCDPGCGEEGYLCERHSNTFVQAIDTRAAETFKAREKAFNRELIEDGRKSVGHVKGTAEWRKQRPLWAGVLRYFPDALLEVAHVSWVGNEQHNPGEPLHWDRSKSKDEGDACARHLTEAGTFDTDGTRHSAKAAWRALALLQKELENEQG